MLFSSLVAASALFLTSAAAAAAPASITVTAFTDTECKSGSGTPITLNLNSCGFFSGAFGSISIPKNIPSAFQNKAGSGCGFRIFDDAGFNCKVAAAAVNVIAPDSGAGKCVPTLIFGNFAGPQLAQAITLNCGPEV